jgi:hypothetical protein
MRAFVMCNILAGMVVAAGGANALDSKDLGALKDAVHDLCVQPDKKGSYLKIEGDLSAGAVLKIIGVGGKGTITKEEWDGINQRLDQYKMDPRKCAISILPILLGAMGNPK